MKLQATRTTAVAYDLETDGSPNSPPAGFDGHLDRGWIRGTTTRAEAVSNVALGGALTEPAEYDESLFVRLTEGAVSYTARALTVTSSAGSLSGATNSTTAAQRDVTFSNVVDERFAAAVTNVTWSVTIPNATLTGSPDWTATTTTEADLDVDPRLTNKGAGGAAGWHFQKDRAAFGVAFHDSTYQMITSEVGQAAARFVGARGTGINGLSVTLTADPDNTGTTKTVVTTTATRDGEAGWTELVDVCESGKPGGAWQLAADITAPADIDGATYALSTAGTVTVLAVDPRFRAIIKLGPMSAGTEGRHLEPGDRLKATATFYNAETFKRLAPDAGTVKLLLIRWDTAGDKYQYLETNGTTWSDWSGSTTAAAVFVMADAGDGVTFTHDFTDTGGWSTTDIVAVGVTGKIASTPYSFYVQRELVSSQNRHDSLDTAYRELSVGKTNTP